MNRILCMVIVSAFCCALGLAQERQLPEKCDWDFTPSEFSGGETRFDMSFCRLDNAYGYESKPYITVTKDVKVKNDAGDEINADVYKQHSVHWNLQVIVGEYADGHPIGIRETEEKTLKSLREKYTILNTHTAGAYGDDENRCYARRILDVLWKNQDGNKVYSRFVIEPNAMMVVTLETFCKNGACDADDFAYNVLDQFRGRAFAYRKECAAVPMD